MPVRDTVLGTEEPFIDLLRRHSLSCAAERVRPGCCTQRVTTAADDFLAF